MKTLSSCFIIALMSMKFATTAIAEQGIDDREAWLEDVVAAIKSGRITDLKEQIKTTLGPEMHKDVTPLVTPLKNAMAGHKAIYVDKIEHTEMGHSFDRHVYAAYYGKREFVFYSFTFAHLEKGWQLYALEYADSLDGLNQPTR